MHNNNAALRLRRWINGRRWCHFGDRSALGSAIMCAGLALRAPCSCGGPCCVCGLRRAQRPDFRSPPAASAAAGLNIRLENHFIPA